MDETTENLKRIGCTIRIEHGVRKPDNKEVTSIQIILDDGWRLEGSAYNQVIKVTAKDIYKALNDSNLSYEMNAELVRRLKTGAVK